MNATSPRKPVMLPDLLQAKRDGRKLAMQTAYDANLLTRRADNLIDHAEIPQVVPESKDCQG